MITLYQTLWCLTTLKKFKPLKTMREKEKMLITSIFSFFQYSFFYPFMEKCYFFRYVLFPNIYLSLFKTSQTFFVVWDSQLVNSLPHTPLHKKDFENIVGKGENAGYQHFLLFPQCFLPSHAQISNFELRLICRQQML